MLFVKKICLLFEKGALQSVYSPSITTSFIYYTNHFLIISLNF